MDPERDEELEVPAQKKEVTPDQKQSPDWYKIKPTSLPDLPDLFIKKVETKAESQAKLEIEFERNKDELKKDMENAIDPYASAVIVRSNEIVQGTIPDSEQFQTIKEKEEKRTGFLGLKKTTSERVIGAKWKDEESTENGVLNKYSRINLPENPTHPQISYSMYLEKEGEEKNSAYPLISLISDPELKNVNFSLSWNPESASLVKEIFAKDPQVLQLIEQAQRSGKENRAKEYKIVFKTERQNDQEYEANLQITRQDGTSDIEQEIKDSLEYFDSTIRESNTNGLLNLELKDPEVLKTYYEELEKLKEQLHPLLEDYDIKFSQYTSENSTFKNKNDAREAIKSLLAGYRNLEKAKKYESFLEFDANTNRFIDYEDNSKVVSRDIMIDAAKAILSKIPTEEHKLNNSQSVLTFPLPK